MSVIQGTANQASTRGFYDFPIEQSLRFNDDDSAYLSWTPASAGNRKTWTFSAWVKLGNLATNKDLFAPSIADQTQIWILSGGAIRFYQQNTSVDLQTTALFRDPSAWYHFVFEVDTTQATASNRIKIYVNGNQVTAFDTANYPTQNTDMTWNTTNEHRIGGASSAYLDGYMAEVNFIDGTALDADSFGELKNGVWIPKDPSGLTYGTNGFRLSFADDAEVEAFNTVLVNGSNKSQKVTGYGFAPDLLWFKNRTSTGSNFVVDTVRGTGKALGTDLTNAEFVGADKEITFDSDGFTTPDGVTGNMTGDNGENYVVWGWKAGDSNVSNTDGSITSTVRANDTYGFSIVSWVGDSTSAGKTIGHGLADAPDFIIFKNRDDASDWPVYHTSLGTDYAVYLNTTGAQDDRGVGFLNSTAPSSSLITLHTWNLNNGTGDDMIAYCWAEKAGYSKFGSYSGDNSTDGSNETTVGFKPAFVLIKNTGAGENWNIYDNTRFTDGDGYIEGNLFASSSAAEVTTAPIEFTDTGFAPRASGGGVNASGSTYIYAAFADTREAAFWLDQSGNDNDWQPVNLDHNDTVADSPTDNFATLNPISRNGSNGDAVFSDGNLVVTRSVGDNYQAMATIPVTSGKWYVELTGISGTNLRGQFGFLVNDKSSNTVSNRGILQDGYAYRALNGEAYAFGTGSSYGATWTDGDVIGLALDADNGSATFYKNGVSQGVAFSGITADNYLIGTSVEDGTKVSINFGQQPFAYTPPTDYLALSTANLPEPTISPADDASPEDYFNTVLYDGGSGTLNITGVGFQPDWTWIKCRNVGYGHHINDAVRGAGQTIFSHATTAEVDYSAYFTSFDSDGFTLAGGTNGFGSTGNNYVAWNWKANGSGVSNTDGSITSTVSANTTSGFSIVSYTGTGSNATVGHGLDSAPEMVIVKRRDSTSDWVVYHTGLPSASYRIYLNYTLAQDSGSAASATWNDTDPTSTVFSIGTNNNVNVNTATHIAYCFHSVEGFSKFGSYTGNGGGGGTSGFDGPFVYTGFRPSFVLVKNASAGWNWIIWDAERDTYNQVNGVLQPNSSNAEYDVGGYMSVDFLSNGFKIRSNDSQENGSGNTHIYMAFAENPFKYSNAR